MLRLKSARLLTLPRTTILPKVRNGRRKRLPLHHGGRNAFRRWILTLKRKTTTTNIWIESRNESSTRLIRPRGLESEDDWRSPKTWMTYPFINLRPHEIYWLTSFYDTRDVIYSNISCSLRQFIDTLWTAGFSWHTSNLPQAAGIRNLQRVETRRDKEDPYPGLDSLALSMATNSRKKSLSFLRLMLWKQQLVWSNSNNLQEHTSCCWPIGAFHRTICYLSYPVVWWTRKMSWIDGDDVVLLNIESCLIT